MNSINPQHRIVWPAAAMLLWLILPAGNALALSTDKDQPIVVEADGMEVDDGKGITTYQGNVVLDQGSIHLTADKLIILQKNGATDEIQAEGQPVKFRQRPDGKDKDVKGSSKQLKYKTNSELIYLIGDAVLINEEGSSTKSDRITYDRTRAVMTAGAKAKGRTRVKTVIEPSKKDGSSK